MNEFLICLKKEWKETIRTKQLFMFIGIAVGMAAFVFAIIALMQIMIQSGVLGEVDASNTIIQMGSATYANSVMFFGTFMISYFLIISVIMLRSVVDKELNEKKWVLPLQAGIKPRNMLLAKIIMVNLVILSSIFIASIFNFFGSLIFLSAGESFMNPGVPLDAGAEIAKMLDTYAMILITYLFYITLVVTINAVSKKGWITVISIMLVMILVSTIFGAIPIGNSNLSNYTPFLFINRISSEMSMLGMTAGAVKTSTFEWLSASISTIVILGLMILWALNSTKIRAK